MTSQVKRIAIIAGVLGFTAISAAYALQDNTGNEISRGRVLSVSSTQIIIQPDPVQISRTTKTVTTEGDSNLAPGATEATDPNGNYKDTTGNPHDTMIGKEIKGTHNSTGISDGNSADTADVQSYSKTTTTTTTRKGELAANPNIQTFQVDAATQLNNLSSINDIGTNDSVEISFTNENGTPVATSITKRPAAVSSKNL